ncbi:MAG: hypothetical protein ACRENQ_14390, partial [Gemmatimonadaceae bacterium]
MLDALMLELEGVVIDTRVARFDALVRALADDGIANLPTGAAEELLGRAPRDAAAVASRMLGVAADPTTLDLIGLRADRYFAERAGQG